MNLARRALIVVLVSAWIAVPSSASGLAGTRNPSFGDGGAAKIGIGADELPTGEVATLPDGRIVIAGATRKSNGEQTPIIIRLLADGRRDPSFGDNGIARPSTYANFGDAAVLADGAVLIASLDARPQSRVGIGVLRVGPNGALDRTFGVEGRAEFGSDGISGAVPRLVALPDGGFFAAAGVGFVAGQGPPADGGSNLYLVKGRPDGSPDPGFGHDGTLNLGAAAAVSMALDPRGGLVFSAFRSPDGTSYGPVHISFDGRVDYRYEDVPSFGLPFSVGLRPDGSVYGAGGRGVVRWRADGTLDQNFGSHGFAAYPHGTEPDYRSPWRTLTVLSSGGVVVTGGEQQYPAVLAGFGPDGTLDRRLGPEGMATFPEARAWYPAGQPAVAADGDLLWPVLGADSGQAELWKLSSGGETGSGVGAGYWLLTSTGQVHAFGGAANLGDGMASSVDIESTLTGHGYWILNRNGVVSAFGDATGLGNVDPAKLAKDEQPASLSATPSGKGYWVFTNRGRAITFGDAAHLGDMAAVKLNGPVLGSVATPSGKGYYMVASDGGIFAFGDAKFAGSMGGKKLNAPVQSLVPDADGKGYWLVASDGGIFAFDAPFRGSMGGTKLNKPVVGMVRYGDGYLMVGADGGIFSFSTSPFAGSLGDRPPASPVVAVAALP